MPIRYSSISPHSCHLDSSSIARPFLSSASTSGTLPMHSCSQFQWLRAMCPFTAFGRERIHDIVHGSVTQSPFFNPSTRERLRTNSLRGCHAGQDDCETDKERTIRQHRHCVFLGSRDLHGQPWAIPQRFRGFSHEVLQRTIERYRFAHARPHTEQPSSLPDDAARARRPKAYQAKNSDSCLHLEKNQAIGETSREDATVLTWARFNQSSFGIETTNSVALSNRQNEPSTDQRLSS